MSANSASATPADPIAVSAKPRPIRLSQPHPPPFLPYAAATLVALGDFLFFDHGIGWTAALFAATLLLAMAALHRNLITSMQGRIMFALLAGLCLALIEQPTFLAVILFTFGLAAFALSDQPKVVADALKWLGNSAAFLLLAIVRVFADLGEMPNWKHHRAVANFPTAMFKAWIFPLALAGVFLFLFASANPIIAGWLEPLQWLRALDFHLPEFWRVVFWCLLAVPVWAFLRVAPDFQRHTANPGPEDKADPTRLQPHADKSQPDVSRTSAEADTPAAQTGFLTQDVIIRSMILFNVVFAVQNVLDVRFLWAGAALPDGVTFASYAHQGTNALTASALLAAFFVLMAFPSNRKEPPPRLAYILMYVWLAQNVFLVISAMQRMGIYVDSYALTYLRLTGLVGMGLVAIGLVLIVARIRFQKSSTWLLNANAAAIVSTLYIACFLDFGRIIAEYNVANCRELGGKGVFLDVGYLRRLGPSALPALTKFTTQASQSQSWSKHHQARQAVKYLTARLNRQQNNWRTWTYREHRLRRELLAMAKRTATQPDPRPARVARRP
ncbi:MAG: DUF4173 domain-containing protein [Alphaproteobacteria bacterium]|nr:DUF4173 domain-containing protein [Alphaproteobacteria bacterium]